LSEVQGRYEPGLTGTSRAAEFAEAANTKRGLFGGLAGGSAVGIPAVDRTERRYDLFDQGSEWQQITTDAGSQDLDKRPLNDIYIIPCRVKGVRVFYDVLEADNAGDGGAGGC
jgi:hypothetical protein